MEGNLFNPPKSKRPETKFYSYERNQRITFGLARAGTKHGMSAAADEEQCHSAKVNGSVAVTQRAVTHGTCESQRTGNPNRQPMEKSGAITGQRSYQNAMEPADESDADANPRVRRPDRMRHHAQITPAVARKQRGPLPRIR